MKIKVFAAGLLPAMMLALLIGCGKKESDPNCGLYEATSAEMMGMTMTVNELFEDGVSLELKDGGKAVINLDGESYKMKWSLDGEDFHAEGGGVELDGTLSEGVLNLENMLDMGVDMELVCEDYSGGEEDADADGAGASGSVLKRLKDAANGKEVYAGEGKASGKKKADAEETPDDPEPAEEGSDPEEEWDFGEEEEPEEAGGEASDIAIAKGLDASWFGDGVVDAWDAGTFYHWWSSMSWDDREKYYDGFYDLIVKQMGTKPLDDNDEEYMDRAEFKFVTEGGGVLSFYLDKQDDGSWSYGGISCTGDVMEESNGFGD